MKLVKNLYTHTALASSSCLRQSSRASPSLDNASCSRFSVSSKVLRSDDNWPAVAVSYITNKTSFNYSDKNRWVQEKQKNSCPRNSHGHNDFIHTGFDSSITL